MDGGYTRIFSRLITHSVTSLSSLIVYTPGQYIIVYTANRQNSLDRPRSCGCMVGDSGQVLGVLGWALTRIRNLPSVLQYRRQDVLTVAVCGTELHMSCLPT